MKNIPDVKIGIIAVSRDCFIRTLSQSRRERVVEEVRKYFKDKTFNTIIPRLIRLVEAPSHGMPINEYEPNSRAALAYMNLAKEVIERDGE